MQSVVAEDKIFQALADPSRRAIFESLTRGEAAVKDLTSRFDISQPAGSQHLAALKVPFSEAPIPGWDIQQLFLQYPRGLKIEMTFWMADEGSRP